MPQGLPGADSSLPVTAALIDAATTLYGTAPVFWGRYFTSVATTGSVEYHHARENGPLNTANIRLLPIARQTPNVNGTEEQGLADGIDNAEDFIATFTVPFLASQGSRFFMFLDVEGTPENGNPSLASDYYTGWVQGLAQQSAAMCMRAGLSADAVQVAPCVYGRQGDPDTWNALAEAADAGIPCGGLWIARFKPNDCKLADWNNAKVTPASPDPFPFTILAWQFSEGCLDGQIDCSQTNPSIDAQAELLDFLIVPPPAAPLT